MDKLTTFLTSDNKAHISVYFPRNFINENSGDLNINKDIFDKLISKFLHKFGKYKKSSEICYFLNEKIYKQINKKFFSIYKIDTSTLIKVDDCIFVKENYIKIHNDEFPKITEYNNIIKQNKMIFTLDFGTLNLITQTEGNNDTTYFIEIELNNLKENKINSLLSTTNFIKSCLK